MTKNEYVIIIALTVFMALAANGLGRWSSSLNPDGIQPHPLPSSEFVDITETTSQESIPRNAFTFGASLGLLGVSLLYCLVAAGLLIRRKSRGLPASNIIYCVAGIAGFGFALSYLVDDYFY
jgi:hypothetical protein